MKSYDKQVSISVRKYKNGKEFIQLRRLPIKKFGDKKVITGDKPTKKNFEKYRVNGLSEYLKLIQKENMVTFSRLVDEVMPIISSGVSEVTKKDREQKLHNHILPTFGKMRVDAISSKDIELWQSKLLSYKGADLTRRCKNLLNRVLQKGVVHKYIDLNPTIGTENIKGVSKKLREIYTKDEISLMLKHAKGWLRLFILVRVYLGLRSTEMVGLRWEDFDFTSKQVVIRRGIRMGKIVPPKTRERLIDVPSIVIDALLAHRESNKSDWVFVSSRGDYWGDCSYINRRHFQPFLKEIGVRYKSFYSLRHSYATYSWVGGVNLPYISHQLGHKDIETTVKFYTKYVVGIGGAEATEKALKF